MVRCASCGHTWHAQPSSDDSPTPADAPDPAPVDDMAEPAPETLAEPDPAPAEPELAPVEAQVRKRHRARFERRAMAKVGAIWGGVAAALMVMMAGAYVVRSSVVSVWPQASSLYAAFGARATVHGLVIDAVAPEIVEEAGADGPRDVLEVRATVRNAAGGPRVTPDVAVDVLDPKGASLFSWTVAMEGRTLAPDQAVRFTAALDDPPPDAAKLSLRFVDAGQAMPAQAADAPDEGGERAHSERDPDDHH